MNYVENAIVNGMDFATIKNNVNGNFEYLGNRTECVLGKYIGNYEKPNSSEWEDVNGQEIILGFKPLLVEVWCADNDCIWNSNGLHKWKLNATLNFSDGTVNGRSYKGLEISDNGFKIHYSGHSDSKTFANVKDKQYYFKAYKSLDTNYEIPLYK